MMLREHPWAILIILLLVVLLFGSSKLPDLARNLGRSLRIVKKEVREMKEDDAGAQASTTSAPRTTTPQAPADPAGDDAPRA